MLVRLVELWFCRLDQVKRIWEVVLRVCLVDVRDHTLLLRLVLYSMLDTADMSSTKSSLLTQVVE